jgi:hypothetical protein
VRRIIDADTVELDVDLGFRVWHRTVARVEGKAATLFAVWLLPLGSRVTVESTRLDKYGDPLVKLTLADGSDYRRSVMAAGHAEPYRRGITWGTA